MRDLAPGLRWLAGPESWHYARFDGTRGSSPTATASCLQPAPLLQLPLLPPAARTSRLPPPRAVNSGCRCARRRRACTTAMLRTRASLPHVLCATAAYGATLVAAPACIPRACAAKPRRYALYAFSRAVACGAVRARAAYAAALAASSSTTTALTLRVWLLPAYTAGVHTHVPAHHAYLPVPACQLQLDVLFDLEDELYAGLPSFYLLRGGPLTLPVTDTFGCSNRSPTTLTFTRVVPPRYLPPRLRTAYLPAPYRLPHYTALFY